MYTALRFVGSKIETCKAGTYSANCDNQFRAVKSMKSTNFQGFRPRSLFRYGQEFLDKRLKEVVSLRKSPAMVCRKCGVRQTGGQWSWSSKALFPRKALCPACLRIAYNKPAGILVLEGNHYREHLVDITALVKHLEFIEKTEHPLSRLMDCSIQGNTVSIRTTSRQFVKSVAAMIQRSFGAVQVKRRIDETGVLVIEMMN